MSYQDEAEIAAWLLEPTPRKSQGGPADWGIGRLRVIPGGPRTAGDDFIARVAELDRLDKEFRRREMRLAVLGWTVALAMAVEVLLAVFMMDWGNHRLPATPRPLDLPPATTTGAR